MLSFRLLHGGLSRGQRGLALLLAPLARALSGLVAASLVAAAGLVTRGAVLVALALSFAVSTAVFDTTYNGQSRVDAELTNGADVTVTGPTATPPSTKLARFEDAARRPGRAADAASLRLRRQRLAGPLRQSIRSTSARPRRWPTPTSAAATPRRRSPRWPASRMRCSSRRRRCRTSSFSPATSSTSACSPPLITSTTPCRSTSSAWCASSPPRRRIRSSSPTPPTSRSRPAAAPQKRCYCRCKAIRRRWRTPRAPW